MLCVQEVLSYEVDSDDEWEDEEQGESIASSEVRLCTCLCWFISMLVGELCRNEG